MNPTCLIVEDHDGLRTVLCNWLQTVFPKIVFTGVATGEEAVDWVQHSEPVAVLMDIRLPGINGIEATRQIKRTAPQTYVIIHTIYDGEAYREDAASAGANAYVSKSQTQTDLLPILLQVFSDADSENYTGQSSAPDKSNELA